jgi:hypothetical protein
MEKLLDQIQANVKQYNLTSDEAKYAWDIGLISALEVRSMTKKFKGEAKA